MDRKRIYFWNTGSFWMCHSQNFLHRFEHSLRDYWRTWMLDYSFEVGLTFMLNTFPSRVGSCQTFMEWEFISIHSGDDFSVLFAQHLWLDNFNWLFYYHYRYVYLWERNMRNYGLKPTKWKLNLKTCPPDEDWQCYHTKLSTLFEAMYMYILINVWFGERRFLHNILVVEQTCQWMLLL